MSSLIEGKFIGVYQFEDSFFGRFERNNQVLDIPITPQQFHSLKLNEPVKLIVQIAV